MALLEVNWTPSRRELRQFSGAWVLFFALITAYCQSHSSSPEFVVATGTVAAAGLIGLVRPNLLRPAYILLTTLALPIGWIVSHLVLVAVYYLLMTPIGVVMRVLGYDPLSRKVDHSATTYWAPHDPGSESARYFKQY